MQHKSIRALKREVLDSFEGDWIEVIKANFIPIIFTILEGLSGTLVIGALVVSSPILFTDPGYSTSVTQSADTAGVANYSSGTDLSFGFLMGAIFLFVIMGIRFGMLDRLRHKNDLTWNAQFQIFSKRYFIPSLAIYIFEFIFKFLWRFLFIIPGFIKAYSYSQSYFIFKDAEDRGLIDRFEYVNFITFSRRLMDGNKARLLWMQISLIGWYILSIFTLGLGFIWLVPYKNGLYAAFYKDLVEQNGSRVLPEIYGN